MDDHYTMQLNDGKYTVINRNGTLAFRRHGEDWPAADSLSCGVVLAMAQRIEALETTIRNVVDGSLMQGVRLHNGLRSYGTAAEYIPLRRWEEQLRSVLGEKP